MCSLSFLKQNIVFFENGVRVFSWLFVVQLSIHQRGTLDLSLMMFEEE